MTCLLVEVLELGSRQFEGGHLRQHDLPAPSVDVRDEGLDAVHRVQRHLTLVLRPTQRYMRVLTLRPALMMHGGAGALRKTGRQTHLDLIEGVEQRVLLAKLEDDLDDTAAGGGMILSAPSYTQVSILRWGRQRTLWLLSPDSCRRLRAARLIAWHSRLYHTMHGLTKEGRASAAACRAVLSGARQRTIQLCSRCEDVRGQQQFVLPSSSRLLSLRVFKAEPFWARLRYMSLHCTFVPVQHCPRPTLAGCPLCRSLSCCQSSRPSQ